MADQAEKLRAMTETALPAVRARQSDLNIVAVTGGQAGVGTTTAAVNLGAALADFGERVLIVDAAVIENNMLCVAGVRRHVEHSLADVVTEQCDVRDALVSGPLGTQLLLNNPRRAIDSTRNVERQLLSVLETISDQFDIVVIDTGSGLSAWTRRIWVQSRLAIVVATMNETALIDAYAVVKRAVTDSISANVGVLANQVSDEGIATNVQRRFATSCQRFLSLDVAALPSLPLADDEGAAGAQFRPRVWEQPDSPFGHAALWLGRAVIDQLENSKTADERSRQKAGVSHTGSDVAFGARSGVAAAAKS